MRKLPVRDLVSFMMCHFKTVPIPLPRMEAYRFTEPLPVREGFWYMNGGVLYRTYRNLPVSTWPFMSELSGRFSGLSNPGLGSRRNPSHMKVKDCRFLAKPVKAISDEDALEMTLSRMRSIGIPEHLEGYTDLLYHMRRKRPAENTVFVMCDIDRIHEDRVVATEEELSCLRVYGAAPDPVEQIEDHGFRIPGPETVWGIP